MKALKGFNTPTKRYEPGDSVPKSAVSEKQLAWLIRKGVVEGDAPVADTESSGAGEAKEEAPEGQEG